MTDDNAVAIHDRQGFLDAIKAIESVKGSINLTGLETIPGATDGSPTAATVARIIAEAQKSVAASDVAIAGIVTDLRAIYRDATGADSAGETGVLEA
ncbi:hypothetical protein [[Mycobacterium] wendilense]|uniref:PE domain-containing protein n=1 Tax=[Mycobacterium] wendilense TaxID=3064284 RepID=A0ABM9M9N4_9MYCO|nr:hypothetical protein [Mycolicibacterium sp. MU0050]CAJ1579798.1 hypothetical protein MU0050_000693 [Mycolicibacterium sp. MU0050]